MTGWAVEAMVASTLLMLVVLALRQPVARWFGPRAAYLLWLLPAARMLLPRLPEAASLRPARIHIDVAHLIAAGRIPAATSLQAAPSALAIDWFSLASTLWIGGAVLFAAWQIGRHLRFLRLALEQAGSAEHAGAVVILTSPAVAGPLATGLLRPRVLLPRDFAERYSASEQRLALAHELAHHRRGDLIANGAALLLLALHWFNPIAHWAYRAFRADQELACDATVLAAAPEARADYGRTLIKAAAAGRHATACGLHPAAELKRRMSMIVRSDRSRLRHYAGGLVAVLCIGTGLGLTASRGIAASSRTMTSARAAHAAAPLAPIPPVPPLPPLPPVAVAAPPAPPAAPLPPPAPLTPPPPIDYLAPDQAAALRSQAMQAGEAARLAAGEAQRAARAAMAHMDVVAIRRNAMAQARAQLERQCTHAAPAPAGETDEAAIGRLAAGCVDRAAINREVQEGLREAQAQLRDAMMLSEDQRREAFAAIEDARNEARRNIR